MRKKLELFGYLFFFISSIRFPPSKAAKILAHSFYPSYSHQIMSRQLWRELSLKGHNVTLITPFIVNDTFLTNLTEIDVGFTIRLAEEANLSANLAEKNFLMRNVVWFEQYLSDLVEAQIAHEDVQKIIRNTENQFDLVVVEGLYPIIYSYGGRFQAPIVSISSLTPFLHCQDMMGNPTHPIYPDMLMTASENNNFMDRLRGFLYNFWDRALFYWYFLPKEDKVARKYFGDDLPYLGDIIMNTSLLLVNANPIMGIPRPNLPNVIEISQMHIREEKPLPKDLQEFLDSSEHGAVYFSLGTNIHNTYLNKKNIEIIIQAFSELPYNILWKSNMDNFSCKPDNVLIRKWFPQQDVLGHPKVKVFVTQGGAQSIEEAIYKEVPMVGLPFFADQPLNIKTLSRKGMALGLNFDTMTKDDLKESIKEVAENGSYKRKIQEAAAILKDQPIKGVEKAIYWIEYVLRHEGAKHLRSPAADMPFHKYFMVDVIVFFLVVYLVCILISIKFYRLIRSGDRHNKIKKN